MEFFSILVLVQSHNRSLHCFLPSFQTRTEASAQTGSMISTWNQKWSVGKQGLPLTTLTWFFFFFFLLRCAIKFLSYKMSGFLPIKMAAFQFAGLFWVNNAALVWLQLINLPKAQYEKWAAMCVLITKVCFLSLHNDWLCCSGHSIPCERRRCLRQEMRLMNATFRVTSLPSNHQTPLWNVCTDGHCSGTQKSLSNVHQCTAAEQ